MAQKTKLSVHSQAFENTSTSIAASQMRNALNNLTDTVKDPEQKKVCDTLRHDDIETSNSQSPAL